MFATDDEEGDFTSPTGGAKLASLFGLDQAASKGNESFQYTAPKQPRKRSGNSGPPSQKPAPPCSAPAVVFATAVQAYRYVNGQYAKQGKVGAAVLGNQTTKEVRTCNLNTPGSKFLLYIHIISHCSPTQVQPSNYCTFYDDQRQNWSLMFESEKAATDFCKEVCLAKVNCGGPLDSVLIQDLLLGEGKAVENGDSLEVAYTGWLLQNQTIGTMFDSNLNKDKLLRLKLGAGKVIKGWEEGMLNMCKGGRRLMVIPPSLAYGSQGVPNRVPPDSTLVFEAEIRRVKCAKDGSSRDSAAPSPAPSVDSLGPSELNQPLSTAPPTNKPSEPPLRAKSNSLNEQLSNPDASKAKLISRMAKMGQPMLPFFTGPASHPDSSDSELEVRMVTALVSQHALPRELGWDQVRLSEELASSTARVSELQLELTSQQQKAAVLQTKLNSALQDSQQHSTHITSLETQLLEFKETAERVQSQYKTEKQKRKEMELKLNGLEEELQDAKTEKDSLERTFSERKRKWQAERRRSDEELEEVRRAAQQEMDNLRNQLRKARTSTDHAAAGQVSFLTTIDLLCLSWLAMFIKSVNLFFKEFSYSNCM
ncbi:putative FK506-binding protein 15-like [Triplophysa rosa]|uniref:peptidylprolyl isomerase n=1 Tax=Triplophysa rosa TaxID=992332 RepID=A0A9W7WFN3_TRIRA|nr:putative FK506-binding protein 15-like [Triplophysa rosa]